jgi:pyruvate dehydrogenase E2 component (dihydrolipoamide acetyltransferase)
MATELIMPELGTTTGDMLVLKVLKNIGDYVKLGEPILEVQTDKANVEVESYAEGYLKQLTCKEGDMVAAGTPIAILGDKDEVIDKAGAAPETGEGAAREAKEDVKETKVIDISSAISTETPTNRVFASPLARKMVKDAGIDIGTIKGTGPGGRIVKDDVLAAIQAKEAASTHFAQAANSHQPAAASQAKPPTPPAPSPQEYLTVELSKMRRTIAKRLAYSFKEIPHFYLSVSVNMGNAVAMKKRFQESSPDRKLTYTDLLIKITSRALKEFPTMNSIYQDEKISQLSLPNISLAISTDEGLITPTLVNPFEMNLEDISAYSKAVASMARDGKLSLRELEPAAITLSNLGMYGVEEFNAIINPPQSSILAIGAIKDELRLKGGGVCEVPYMKLTLSVDHRIIDGVLAAKFLNYIKDCLENPEQIVGVKK